MFPNVCVCVMNRRLLSTLICFCSSLSWINGSAQKYATPNSSLSLFSHSTCTHMCLSHHDAEQSQTVCLQTDHANQQVIHEQNVPN